MKLGTHMPGGERRKPIDIEDRSTKVKSAYNMINGVRASGQRNRFRTIF